MEVARLLARSGWIVGIAGRRVDRLLEVEASENNILCHKAIDVTCGDAPGLLAELIEELGGMDLYFHSSGIGWQNNLLDEEKEIRTVETNGVGFVRMVDAAFNWFSARAAGGESPSGIASVSSAKPFRIACITSIAGTRGLVPLRRILPPSVCRTIILNVFRSWHGCAGCRSALPTYGQASWLLT